VTSKTAPLEFAAPRLSAALVFDDRAADRQSKAHAGRFGREERLEDAIPMLWRNSFAGVAD
jgi:hypothetical protein